MESGDKENKENENVDTDPVTLMSSGFKTMFVPPVQDLETKLGEISKNQKEILFISEKEKEGIENVNHFKEIEQRFQKLPTYIQKAKNLKKDMKYIQEKLRKLRKRSNVLKQDFGIQNQ